ncbi:peptidoglycan-binding protein [Patiriisocius marinistellae]|uniref:Peptidoglycan-binding protein n=1 Tax=Patiriisocius marinistellae TaxID=2494560 RepID=A0A5J4FZI7_9FLAO|nr:N-acetylmuramidase family protein [Patiriisocius marinistellae]GEQ85121.1 peptidoglycan-binding protein [Patiriisocius marinistellae]
MQTLKLRSRNSSVHVLEELLTSLGYEVYVSNYFGTDTDRAVKDFQSKNDLVVDGIVGAKTWAILLNAQQQLTQFNNKFLSEDDLKDFASQYGLELAAVKAVNEVESNGKGFLLDGRPRILFEGHVFWRELKARNVSPETLINEHSKNVLYKSWTKKFYEGGKQEFDRLEKAAGLSDDDLVHNAAYVSASYGAFQIMGFHYQLLGYSTVDSYVADMYTHERQHLKAFGLFCKANNLIRHLKSKNWASFARGYNGPEYAANKYDTKLASAYRRYIAM